MRQASLKMEPCVFEKYGNIEYKYVAEISRKHDASKIRHITLKTGWLIKSAVAEGNFTSIQSQTQGVSHFPRTATVTPLERYIKQNDADERKISSKELAKSVGCVMMGKDE